MGQPYSTRTRTCARKRDGCLDLFCLVLSRLATALTRLYFKTRSAESAETRKQLRPS